MAGSARKIFASLLGGTLQGTAEGARDQILAQKKREARNKTVEFWGNLLKTPNLTVESQQRIADKMEQIAFGETEEQELQIKQPEKGFTVPIPGMGDVDVDRLPKSIQEDFFRKQTGIVDPAEQSLIESRKALTESRGLSKELTGEKIITEKERRKNLKQSRLIQKKKFDKEKLSSFGKKQAEMFDQIRDSVKIKLDEIRTAKNRFGDFLDEEKGKLLNTELESLKFQLNQIALSAAPKDYIKMAPEVFEIYFEAYEGNDKAALDAFLKTPMGQEYARAKQAR